MEYTFNGRLGPDLHFMFKMETGERIDTMKVYMERKDDAKTALTYRLKDFIAILLTSLIHIVSPTQNF